jgi:hypothetical protein
MASDSGRRLSCGYFDHGVDIGREARLDNHACKASGRLVAAFYVPSTVMNSREYSRETDPLTLHMLAVFWGEASCLDVA